MAAAGGATFANLAKGVAVAAAVKVAGNWIGNKINGGGGDGRDPFQMPANPHVQTQVGYTLNNRSSYVPGRGFRKL